MMFPSPYTLCSPEKNVGLVMTVDPDRIAVFFLRKPVKISFIEGVQITDKPAPAKAVLLDHAVLTVGGNKLDIGDILAVGTQVIQALVENSGHSDKTLYPQQYDQNTDKR